MASRKEGTGSTATSSSSAGVAVGKGKGKGGSGDSAVKQVQIDGLVSAGRGHRPTRGADPCRARFLPLSPMSRLTTLSPQRPCPSSSLLLERHHSRPCFPMRELGAEKRSRNRGMGQVCVVLFFRCSGEDCLQPDDSCGERDLGFCLGL